jgi:FixJ family two-component response regulator
LRAKLLTQNNEFKFDIVLLNSSLPDNSGEQLIIEIVSLKLDCPIIALTGYTDIDFSIKSMSLGIADYLLKDVNPLLCIKVLFTNIERTKTNFKLFESEKRYSDYFQLSPQPMWVFDLETLCFLDVNGGYYLVIMATLKKSFS